MTPVLPNSGEAARLGNWNDRRFGHDSRSESSWAWRLLDGVARWLCLRNDAPRGCGHSDDVTFDGRWCGICDPILGGQGAARAEDYEPIDCEPWMTDAQKQALEAIQRQNVIWNGSHYVATAGGIDIAVVQHFVYTGLARLDDCPVTVRYLVLTDLGQAALSRPNTRGGG